MQDTRLDERYVNDPTWHALVDMLEAAYASGQYTASDVRTAAIYAMVRHEMRAIRPLVMHLPPDHLR